MPWRWRVKRAQVYLIIRQVLFQLTGVLRFEQPVELCVGFGEGTN
jgi:hypothetical protein